MLLSECGFTFNGVHSRDGMGLIYAEKDGHIIIPRIRRNTYEIAGVSGNILMDGETRDTITFEGTLYPARERPTQAEAQELLRQVSAWLTAGRRPLVFDYEPDVYYLAELSAQSKWSLKNWFGGELPIKFEAQPWAYAMVPAEAQATVTGTTASLTLRLQTGQPAPLYLSVANQGSAKITGVSVLGCVFQDLDMSSGTALAIDMEPPIGAELRTGGLTQSALPYAVSFPLVTLPAGTNTVRVTITYGSGTKKALVTARARGRW